MPFDFADVEKLPDDVKFVLPDGKEVTLGDIRDSAKEWERRRIAELTPREQKLAAGERTLAEESARVREAMEALANAPPPSSTPGAQPTPFGYTQAQWDVVRADPYTKPLVETMAMLAAKVHEQEERINTNANTWTKQQESQRQEEEKRWINYQFELMAKDDPSYADPANRQSLIDYAKEVLNKRDITVLHRARNYDKHIESARKEAYEKGLKEGTSRAPIPSVPYRTSPPTPTPAPEKLPSSHSQFVDEAMADPDLIQSIRDAASQP